MSEKHIVIVGSGYAGIHVLTDLESKNLRNTRITLISKTNFFYHNVATPRCLIDESVISRICMPMDNLLRGPNKSFIHGRVSHIDKNELKYVKIVDNKELNEEILSFDYLILALGSDYSSNPFAASEFNKQNQIDYLKELNKKLANCKRVLVIGGGSVGAELAAEIKTDCPDKHVMLITTGNRLVSSMDQKFSQKTFDIIERKGVELIFNDTVDVTKVPNFTRTSLKSQNGHDLVFDCYFVCTGAKPATSWLNKIHPEWIDSKGFIKVNEYLQVNNELNIFALGDCCNTNELKMAAKINGHSPVVAHNIATLIKGGNKSSFKDYDLTSLPASLSLMLLTCGRDNGVFRLGCLCVTGFLPKKIKCEDLFIERYTRMLKN